MRAPRVLYGRGHALLSEVIGWIFAVVVVACALFYWGVIVLGVTGMLGLW